MVGCEHVGRVIAEAVATTPPVEALPAFPRDVWCPTCRETARHIPVRVDGPSRWWRCACGFERILDTVAVPA